jgi:hypothetical protein
MSYGLTEYGFNAKRLPNLLIDCENSLNTKFQKKVDVSPKATFGILNGIYNKTAIDLWEIMEDLYHQQHVNECNGIHQDYLYQLNSLQRLPAISSQVIIGLQGNISTIIPQNTLIQDLNGNNYYAKSQYIITNLNQLLFYVTIKTIANLTDYTLQIGETIYTYTSSSNATESEIINGLFDQIDQDITKVIVIQNLIDKTLKLSYENTFSIEISDNLYFWTPAVFLSVEKENIYVAINTITEIVNNQVGWELINNFEEMISGRRKETDEEFRERRRTSLQVVGGGNLNAIVSRVLNDVPTIKTIKGFENSESVQVGDLPPNCISLYIEGAEDKNKEIAESIWNCKGGGIPTYGNFYYDIIDSNGTTQRIKFSRPVYFYTWVKVEYSKYDEEIFPSNGEETIKLNILNFGDTFVTGLDIIPQRFFKYIFEVDGIEEVIVSVFASLNEEDTPSYQLTPISVEIGQIAKFNIDRIIVEEV